MSQRNVHIIQKQVLEVEMENPADAFQFRNRLGEVFHERILPALETLFDEIGHDNRLIRIDQLQVDIGRIPYNNWEQELADKTIDKLRELLLLEIPLWQKETVSQLAATSSEKRKSDFDVPKNKKPVNQLTQDGFINAFFYFLQTGRLPWFVANEVQFNEQLKKWLTPENVASIKTHLEKAGLTELTRLIYQVEEALLDQLIELILTPPQASSNKIYALFMEAKHFLEKLLKSILINNTAIKKLLYLPFFKWQSSHAETDLSTFYTQDFASLLLFEFPVVCNQPGFINSLSRAQGNSKLPGNGQEQNTILKNITQSILFERPAANTEKEQLIKDEKTVETPGEIYIENAGLVLLHPFLLPFFKTIELTTKDQFIDEYARMKAVLFTQYLVNGMEAFEEHQLVLNKIICGFPLHTPITKDLEITNEEKAEAADLLQQVIQLWTKNNVQVNGTIEGLQQSFLQRPGKLVQKDKDWQLQVEQKPYDMVLSALPWGIGIIKNPWMQGMLWVDWA